MYETFEKKTLKKNIRFLKLFVLTIEHCTRTFFDKIASDFKEEGGFSKCYEIFRGSVDKICTYLYGLESTKTRT